MGGVARQPEGRAAYGWRGRESQQRQGPCGSFLEASHGPPEGPNPLISTPSTLRRGGSVRASLASVQLLCLEVGCFCRRAVLAVRLPPVAVGMPSRCLAGTAAGTDAVHCACIAADR